MAAFTVFAPQWGFARDTADSGRLWTFAVTDRVGKATSFSVPTVTPRARWQRDANGGLVCRWNDGGREAEASPPH